MLTREYSRLGIAGALLVRNDAFAPLRAGTDGVGVAVICGSGMNAAGVSGSGRTARFPALVTHYREFCDSGGGRGDLSPVRLLQNLVNAVSYLITRDDVIRGLRDRLHPPFVAAASRLSCT